MSNMSPAKALLTGALAVLALLAGVGCPLPLEGGLIRLQIDTASESRRIEVGDFEVGGLRIRVRDPAGEVLETIDWDAAEGPRTYWIPVPKAGDCEIEVIHFGEQEGESVQAAEREVFEVPARRVTSVDIVPGCIGVIRIQN